MLTIGRGWAKDGLSGVPKAGKGCERFHSQKGAKKAMAICMRKRVRRDESANGRNEPLWVLLPSIKRCNSGRERKECYWEREILFANLRTVACGIKRVVCGGDGGVRKLANLRKVLGHPFAFTAVGNDDRLYQAGRKGLMNSFANLWFLHCDFRHTFAVGAVQGKGSRRC